MTRLPAENQDVKGLKGPEYELNGRCAIPACDEFGSERHHCWRRSFLIGDFWWVETPDGAVVGNCVKLCHYHHEMITQNHAQIVYDDGRYFFNGQIEVHQALTWQPPFFTSVESFYTERAIGPLDVTFTDPDLKTPGKEETTISESGICPTCERPLPKPKIETPPEKKRVRLTWSVSVPKDKQEDGAEVLDTLIEEARLEFAKAGLEYGEEGIAKYPILATALALFVTHAEEIL